MNGAIEFFETLCSLHPEIEEQLAELLTARRAQNPTGPRFLTPAEFAAQWGAHEETVRRWVREGRIDGVQKLGRLVRIPEGATVTQVGAEPAREPSKPKPRRSRVVRSSAAQAMRATAREGQKGNQPSIRKRS